MTKLKAHLAGDLGQATLCNVKARRWVGKKLVSTRPRVVGLAAFRAMSFSDQCGRCFLVQCANDGTPVVRQR